jgi:uncharacterized protein YbjT (DUF2867 family)
VTSPVLVTGATGFVGARLAERLVELGRPVRVLVRDPARLPAAAWVQSVEVVRGDANDPGALARAMQGVEVAHYLLHAMSDGDDWADADRELASTFARVAATAGLRRIVYLGGLLPPPGTEATEHLASRDEVAQILLAAPVPAVVLRAGMVIGRGSASFDLLEVATRLLPVVVGPRWLQHRMQPVALDDLLHYLVAVTDLEDVVNRSFDVGGADVVSYRDLLRAHASAAGRRRPSTVLFPVLLPHTFSLVVGTLAPGPSSLNAALVHSLSVDMVCTERDLDALVGPPPGGPTGVDEALRRACA